MTDAHSLYCLLISVSTVLQIRKQQNIREEQTKLIYVLICIFKAV